MYNQMRTFLLNVPGDKASWSSDSAVDLANKLFSQNIGLKNFLQ